MLPARFAAVFVLLLDLMLGFVLGAAPSFAAPAVDGGGGADAQARTEPPRAPSITVSAGAVLPLFLPYEFPGPWMEASLAWPLRDRLQLAMNAGTGALVATGSTRILGSLGGGVRYSPWWRIWGQLGVGATGYVERIGVVLPERDVRATDHGVALTGDLAIGVRVTPRWEIALRYDHQLLSTGTEMTQPGNESLPYTGTGMLSIGRKL